VAIYEWEQGIVKLGYARVSTNEQNLAMQIRTLKEAGAERIFTDQGISGAAVIKPAWREALEFARAGDELIVWRLDRISRSLRDLIDEFQVIKGRNLVFRSLHEQIETETAAGQLFFHIIGAFAQFERDIIRDRTLDGLANARAAGKRLGRPPAISDAQWIEVKRLMTASPPLKASQAATVLGITRQAVHARLRREAAPVPDSE
jgi:DNA invertase Pin-like site-specific DNA recombinase